MPSSTSALPFSPAELSYLHTSLVQHKPPLRPDGRNPTQFRPLVAETNLLPAANGSARVCFAEGDEAVVGIKAEVVPAHTRRQNPDIDHSAGSEADDDDEDDSDWVDVAIDVPGLRDDDSLPVFLAAMLKESLTTPRHGREVSARLRIGNRFRWRIYIDVLLLSSPSAYPLPLLSSTVHLALRSVRLPRAVSGPDDDPLFDDDWDASTYLYPPPATSSSVPAAGRGCSSPPVTLLAISVDDQVLFDPSAAEIAVADALVALSIAAPPPGPAAAEIEVVALRTIDPPARATAAGIPMDAAAAGSTAAGGGTAPPPSEEERRWAEAKVRKDASVWRPPRGGVKRAVIASMVRAVVADGGVGREVLDGLSAVEV